MAIKILGNVNSSNSNRFYSTHKTYGSGASNNKYKTIRDLSWDIRKIKNQTEYIKQTGKDPPTTPDYYMKKLNIIS